MPSIGTLAYSVSAKVTCSIRLRDTVLMFVPYSMTTYRSTCTPASVEETTTPRRRREFGRIFAMPSAALGAHMPTTP